jgi:hypothetical protein
MQFFSFFGKIYLKSVRFDPKATRGRVEGHFAFEVYFDVSTDTLTVRQ